MATATPSTNTVTPPKVESTVAAASAPPPETAVVTEPSRMRRFRNGVGGWFRRHRRLVLTTARAIDATVVCAAAGIGSQVGARFVVAHVGLLAGRLLFGVPVVNVVAVAFYVVVMLTLGWFLSGRQFVPSTATGTAPMVTIDVPAPAPASA